MKVTVFLQKSQCPLSTSAFFLLFCDFSSLDLGLNIRPLETLFKYHFFPPGAYSDQNFNQNNIPGGSIEGEKRAGEEGLDGIGGQMASLLQSTNSWMNKTFD